MKPYEQIVAELNANIPRDAVSQREAGQGRKLSYLEGWYVKDRLNQVFGQGNWAYNIQDLKEVHSGTIKDKYGNDVHTVHYIAQIDLRLKFASTDTQGKGGYYGDNWCSITDVGYGDGTDKQNPGKAHELAVKEAVTDGVKRCAMNLGMSMGMALYDKTQAFVGEEEAPAPKTEPKPAVVVTSITNPSPVADRKTVESKIGVLKKILKDQKKLTDDGYKELVVKYGVASAKELDSTKLLKFYGDLEQLTK